MILWWSFNFGRQWNPSCETTVEMGTEYCSTVVVVFSSGWSFGGESGAVHTADCPPVFVGGKLVQSQHKVGRVNGTWGGGGGGGFKKGGCGLTKWGSRISRRGWSHIGGSTAGACVVFQTVSLPFFLELDLYLHRHLQFLTFYFLFFYFLNRCPLSDKLIACHGLC